MSRLRRPLEQNISHVDIRYLSGLIVNDESISRPDYTIDGGAGDENLFAIVKSGTTSEQFDCVPSNTAPTALLDIQTPPIDQMLEHCCDSLHGLVGRRPGLRAIEPADHLDEREREFCPIATT